MIWDKRVEMVSFSVIWDKRDEMVSFGDLAGGLLFSLSLVT